MPSRLPHHYLPLRHLFNHRPWPAKRLNGLFIYICISILILLLTGCRTLPTPPVPTDHEFQLAERYFLEGKFQKALTSYQSFERKYSSSTYLDYVYYQMGLCYLLTSKYDEAIIQLQKARQTARPALLKTRILMALGNTYLGQGDYPKATQYYQLALNQNPEETHQDEILFNLAIALMRDGQWPQGKQYLKKLLNLKFIQSHLIEAAKLRISLPENIFIVQLGKFQDQENALQYLTEIRETKDISATLKIILVEGKTFYCISAGSFSDWRRAKLLADKLQGKGVEAIVIP